MLQSGEMVISVNIESSEQEYILPESQILVLKCY